MRTKRDFWANCWVPRALLVCLLACSGCAKEKPTSELISDLKSGQGHEKISAARSLPERDEDAAKVIAPLIEALKDKNSSIRRSSAIGLGNYGEKAKEAIPALQALQRDSDARVREAASVALSRIDPSRFPTGAKARPGSGK